MIRKVASAAADVGARVLYGIATAFDVVADVLAHRHKPRF